MARPPIDLNEIGLFLRVAQLGGVTAAARALSLPKSTVSRKLTQLEERLGVRLLQRTPRHLSLTEAGALYYERCGGLLAQIEEAEAALTARDAAPRGLLRVSVGVDFGATVCSPLVQEFLKLHPQVSVELHLTDRSVDVVTEGFDLAIRIGAVRGAALLTRTLGTTHGVLCASPAYLLRRGQPRTPDELSAHSCLVYNAPPHTNEWKLSSTGGAVEVRVNAALTINSLSAVRDAAVAGLGVARLPTFICGAELDAGRLQRVLPEWSTGERPIHALYTGGRSGKNLPTKLRVFLDFLTRRMPTVLPARAT